MNVIKSIVAVFAGFFTIVVFSGGVDALLEAVGFYPPDRKAFTIGMFSASIFYRILISILGGFVVGKLAPGKPMKHVVVLAIIGTLIGILGVVTGWNLPGYPHWYAISLAALTFPTIWFGGKLAVGKNATT